MKKIITFGHTKGGVGKSTLAFNLANAIQKTTDEKVTIIDLDFQQTLYFISNINEENTIKVLQPQSPSELIEMLEELHGYIIIDLGGFDNDINRIAIRYSNILVVPISISITELIGLKTFEEILREINSSVSIKILFNDIHPLTKDLSTIKQATQLKLKDVSILNTVIYTRAIYKTSIADGKSVLEYGDAKAKNEILRLTNELIQY